jgi:hypothetical protein
MLLADRRGGPALPASLASRTFFAWNDYAEGVAPEDEADAAASFADPSRCQSAPAGAAAFTAAVQASRGLPAAEKSALIAARQGLRVDCAQGGGGGGLAAPPAVKSGAGREFLRYLQGAQAFYDGDFATSASAFGEAAGARDPWVAHSARYMAARTALNAAQSTAFDEYGSLVEPAKRDRERLIEAERGFLAYLEAYPNCAYAASARGLLRRVHWLAGDEAKLGQDYAAVAAAPLGPEAALRVAEEIDYKLPSAQSAAAGPLLLAVSDLQRMRTAPQDDGYDTPQVITAAELAGQATAFASMPRLHDYVRAAHAFYVAKSPTAVLKLIPDQARTGGMGALDFSRQMLRGLALDAVGDRNARGFWLELIGSASGPGQRHAVELALARHDEATGGLARVFAPDSQVRDPLARAILLAKQLTRGFYADFLRDLALVPTGARADNYFAEADAFASPDEFRSIQPSPGLFVSARLGDYGCPELRQTVATLERNPLAPTARLCLGEFLRDNGFDYFPFDEPLEQGLGSSRPQFPGTPVTRQAIYRGVIADPAASAPDKAYALFRAVNCYAPTGINGCGGQDAPLAERKGWFQRLKRDYPQSRWARELRYYW